MSILAFNTATDPEYLGNLKNYVPFKQIGVGTNLEASKMISSVIIWKGLDLFEMMSCLMFGSRYYFDFINNTVDESRFKQFIFAEKISK